MTSQNLSKMAFGNYIRKLREEKQLLLREVASQMNIDTALLSKIERSTRIARKEQVEDLAKALGVSENELLQLWMADKIVNMIKDESNSTEILNKVQEEIKNLKN
ncbi:MAG: helix-turn-helix transcriptional regulator [Ignavibacteriae bacterium]|nr:helix-turn-helix transcriptional regulator [Ignavibacteriota bacterium]MCB0752062.1 helix-turn-helix transcriptional regulator [Ignavibacteriota bacterium]